MESGSARWIGWALPWGAWVRWYTTDSLRNVALIRPSVRTGAPSPQGKVAAKQTNEGYLLKAVRSVLRQPRTVRDHESNPFGEAKHHKTRKALPIRESLSYLSISANGEELTPRTGGWRGSGRRCRAAGPRWSCPCSPGAWPARWPPRRPRRRRCPPAHPRNGRPACRRRRRRRS